MAETTPNSSPKSNSNKDRNAKAPKDKPTTPSADPGDADPMDIDDILDDDDDSEVRSHLPRLAISQSSFRGQRTFSDAVE